MYFQHSIIINIIIFFSPIRITYNEPRIYF